MASSSSRISTSTVLGKRKAEKLVLHLASSPEPSQTQSDSDFQPPVSNHASSSKTSSLIVVNGQLVAHTKKKYMCTISGCSKAYSKPSRLEEHERSHNGERPFVCEMCDKSYLRETHLQAHTRSHLPESARPLACSQLGCERRFWTTQHLKVHQGMHDGAKPYTCTAASCDEAFAKNHQLRAHICSAHAPAGSKPYFCEHDGCNKSFSTNQKLRTHSKVHDDKRYTCSHPSCVATQSSPIYFATWTILQHHTRSVHPPTCTHASCDGRTFASHHGLRAHLKLHEERVVEEELDDPDPEAENQSDGEEGRPRKRRRGGELGRDWMCEMEGCKKDFKSKKAMMTHYNVTHLGRRDFACAHPGCGSNFGYKHLLQRHIAKLHSAEANLDSASSENGDDEHDEIMEKKARPTQRMDIDFITGKAYNTTATARLASSTAMRCPHPHLPFVAVAEDANTRGSGVCAYVFSRAYDLRRHLLKEHGVDAEKDDVNAWVVHAKANLVRSEPLWQQ